MRSKRDFKKDRQSIILRLRVEGTPQLEREKAKAERQGIKFLVSLIHAELKRRK